ncbi:hypothetical protein L226DRAFT_84217 [Lentinus tigrinus ALCF2SS1-7]|uniref:uncharacterized protein n=1 Tax=Lentinus tigrinus ALCF2SS1-7 TaxID=1328758 RepID=UPI001165E4F5|nr:hypothetical protein L226DRAFT_84217 [Lentinus tigrinus ALCF2SS1-7]
MGKTAQWQQLGRSTRTRALSRRCPPAENSARPSGGPTVSDTSGLLGSQESAPAQPAHTPRDADLCSSLPDLDVRETASVDCGGTQVQMAPCAALDKAVDH